MFLKNKSIFLGAFFSLNTLLINAQNYDNDALKYSSLQTYGTARAMGAGGAFSSVGADLSSLSMNPAGAGLYRSFEIGITGALNFNNTTSNYTADNTSFSKATSMSSRFTLPQIGMVIAGNKQRSKTFRGSNLKFLNFGISYNRVADFNGQYILSGVNKYNSYSDAISNVLNSNTAAINYDNFAPEVVLGNSINAVYQNSSGYLVPNVALPVQQTLKVVTKGGIQEIGGTLAGNINDKVFFGIGLGIPVLSYDRTFSITETPTVVDSNYSIQNFNISNRLHVSGMGVNGNFGVIVRPVKWMRIGASIKTPSMLWLSESYSASATSTSIYAQTITPDNYLAAPFTYAFVNPWKGTLGLSFYAGKWGFISADYTMSNLASGKFNFNSYTDLTNSSNQLIHAKYGFTNQVKVGAEFAYSVLRLRGGFAWNQSPFKSPVSIKGTDQSMFTYTAGIGFRGKVFFADVAYAFSKSNDFYSPYSMTNNEPSSVNKIINHKVLLTLGLKFGKKG